MQCFISLCVRTVSIYIEMALPAESSTLMGNDTANRATKRRRKAIKSCTFCRKRKLKCDHAKPMCKQCRDRKLPNCIYTDDFNYDITTDELFGNSPNVDLIQRVKELEARLESFSKMNEEYSCKRSADITPQSMSTCQTNTTPSTDNTTARSSISCLYTGNPIDAVAAGTAAANASAGANAAGTASTDAGIVNGNGVVTCFMYNDKSSPNPLWDYRILSKMDGQSIIFGPTSWRTTVAAQGKRFLAEYMKLWEMIKPERERWMIQNSNPNFCSPVLPFCLRSSEPTGLIESICKVLPSKQDIVKDIDFFFNSSLHDILGILDKEKTLKDLGDCFVFSENSMVGFGKPVIDLVLPQNDGNFYKIAVILMIICIVEYDGCIQQAINKFFLSLSAHNSSSRLNFVERLQFLLLRFFNKVYCSYDCSEAIQLSNLSSEICDCSLTLGLSHSDFWYKDQECIVGPLATLRNMWLWSLYVDVVVSFEMGKPPFISDDHFDPAKTFDNTTMDTETEPNTNPSSNPTDHETIEKSIQERRNNLLLQFLKITRKCMLEINGRSTSGNIQECIDSLINYVETMFLPIKFYTMKEKIQLVDLFDIVVLSPTLGMLLNFHNIQRMCFKETSHKVKNGLVKFGLLSLSLSVNILLFICDKEGIDSNEQLHLVLFLINPLLLRVLSEMYALFFYRVSLFERGVVTLCDHGISEVSIDSLKSPETSYYSFNATILKFRRTIDQLFDSTRSDLQKKISKSYQLTTALALERVSRTLFDKGLESRTMTENSCGINDENFISEDLLNQMTDIFWNNYEQQSQDLWHMKPQDFYANLGFSQLDIDLDLKE